MKKLNSFGKSEKGSLSLEQVLFISAIAVIAGGVAVFYGKIDNYFRTTDLATPSTSIGVSSSGGTPTAG